MRQVGIHLRDEIRRRADASLEAVRSVPELVAQANRASSMRANPIALTPGELSEMLLHALAA
jgi:hypothetical protein